MRKVEDWAHQRAKKHDTRSLIQCAKCRIGDPQTIKKLCLRFHTPCAKWRIGDQKNYPKKSRTSDVLSCTLLYFKYPISCTLLYFRCPILYSPVLQISEFLYSPVLLTNLPVLLPKPVLSCTSNIQFPVHSDIQCPVLSCTSDVQACTLLYFSTLLYFKYPISCTLLCFRCPILYSPVLQISEFL